MSDWFDDALTNDDMAGAVFCGDEEEPCLICGELTDADDCVCLDCMAEYGG